MKINYIECSPRGERSHSTKIAQAYIEQAKKNIPDLELNHINPWSLNLPEFDGDMLNAKYSVIRGTDPSADEVSAWSNVKNIFDEFSIIYRMNLNIAKERKLKLIFLACKALLSELIFQHLPKTLVG